MDRIETLKKLASNPHYHLSYTQAEELSNHELYTQEVRADDTNVNVPTVRRKKRAKKTEVRRDTVSEEDIRPKVQEVPDLPEPNSES